MPRQLANPVQKPVAAAVALDSIELRVSRTEKLAIHKISVQGGVRTYSAAGEAIERIGVEFNRADLTDDEAAALAGCVDVIERMALRIADRRGSLPNSGTSEAERTSALK